MPDDYILRSDAKKILSLLPLDLDAETVQRCIEAMSRVPAADVEPKRKTGRWNMIEDTAYCTVCGESVWIEGLGDYDPIEDFDLHYCPCCGAKMEENDGPGE